ncbi:MAG: hypothetical protein HKN21_11085 [Candidatus Eisenbacteria bacterium]|uniref:DUF2867 domain-containing protein n=1 Tax=Eiseniibacteriota bacterium TaxID=2212470 RepID=A0A7Y2H2N5_UNCEI|nr:hypothetical protein [Candidatus Eisenbacteria bacterium]
MSLIDTYLSKYDYTATHQTRVNGKPSEVYPEARHLDFNESWKAKVLFKLRRLPFEDLTLDAMVKDGSFAVLEESPPNEFVVGLMGSPRGKPVPITDAEAFLRFNKVDGLKVAWNFLLTPEGQEETRVSTETRILCLGPSMKRKFSIYWFFVRPFSGLLRKEMLGLVRKRVA